MSVKKIILGFVFIAASAGVFFFYLIASEIFAEDTVVQNQKPAIAPAHKSAVPNQTASTPTPAGPIDKGDFTLAFVKPDGDAEQLVYTILKDDDTFQNLLDAVNEVLALPRNIPVEFSSCGQPNAFYLPDEKKITMCYELLLDYIKLLDDEELSDEELGTKVIQAATFILFHEIGHCLVDNLDLPITGKEEDAVDDFAAVFAVNLDEEGESIVISSIESFGAWADEEGTENLSFEDEHSLSAQRYYSIACVLYGSDPEKFADMVSDDFLPQARAEGCPYEYQQKSKSWNRLLGQYLKTPAE